MGKEKCIHVYMGKHEGRRTLGRPMHRWKANINIDFT
jgi:hypothetical protein